MFGDFSPKLFNSVNKIKKPHFLLEKKLTSNNTFIPNTIQSPKNNRRTVNQSQPIDLPFCAKRFSALSKTASRLPQPRPFCKRYELHVRGHPYSKAARNDRCRALPPS